MPLEQANYIHELVESNPVGSTDLVSEGDDHLRLIKKAVKASFPQVKGAVAASHTELSHLKDTTGVTGTGKLVRDKGAEVEDFTATGDISLNGVDPDDYARLSQSNEFSGQVPVVGTHATETRIRRNDAVGMLSLTGGANLTPESGARLVLYGTDHPDFPGRATIVGGGAGGRVDIEGDGTIKLNGVVITDYARQSQRNVFTAAGHASPAVEIASTTPGMAFYRTGLAEDAGLWGVQVEASGALSIVARGDDRSSGSVAVRFARSGKDIPRVTLGPAGSELIKGGAGGCLHNASGDNAGGKITISSSEATTAAQVGDPGDMRFVYL